VTRTLQLKVRYGGSIAALGAIVCAPLLWFQAPLWGWAVAALVLLIPGRITAHYYRDLLTGRRLMDAGRFTEAVPYFERFVHHIEARPGLKRLIWFSAGAYTRDVEAMALNNLGASRLELGELDRAEAPLRRALAIDPHYPIPYVNLAELALRRDDLEAAAAASSAAKRLGYRGSRVDALLRRASGTLAALEGGLPPHSTS
jgi:tetratricopeptide (TPR) repeat protein